MGVRPTNNREKRMKVTPYHIYLGDKLFMLNETDSESEKGLKTTLNLFAMYMVVALAENESFLDKITEESRGEKGDDAKMLLGLVGYYCTHRHSILEQFKQLKNAG